MKRLIGMLLMIIGCLPFALAACTWNFVPGVYSGCEGTVDCWESNCFPGQIASEMWYCSKQGSLCCECYTFIRPCRKYSGSNIVSCGGYFYYAEQYTRPNRVCGAYTPPGGQPQGSRCFEMPQ